VLLKFSSTTLDCVEPFVASDIPISPSLSFSLSWSLRCYSLKSFPLSYWLVQSQLFPFVSFAPTVGEMLTLISSLLLGGKLVSIPMVSVQAILHSKSWSDSFSGGTGNCDGAVTGANGKPIQVPCQCPPNSTFFLAVSLIPLSASNH